MVSPQYPLRSYILGLLIIISLQSAAAQTCAQATAVAQTWLDQIVEDCAADRSTCGLDSECGSECVDGGDSYTNSCVDGCSYRANGYTVVRSTSGAYGSTYVYDPPMTMYTTVAGHTHTFAEGASGTLSLVFEAVINDLKLSPALGGMHKFSFNGSPCVLEQRYCDADQTSANYYVDCTSVDGGSIMDLCLGMPELTTESSLLEILYWLPTLVCQSKVSPPVAPTNSATGTPSVAPASAPGGDSPGTSSSAQPNNTESKNDTKPTPSQNEESPGNASSAVNDSRSFFAMAHAMAGTMLVGALVLFV